MSDTGGFQAPQFGANGASLQAIDTDLQQIARAVLQAAQAVLQVAQNLKPTPQVVTGSRGGNAALASLLTGLAASGFIVDHTTP